MLGAPVFVVLRCDSIGSADTDGDGFADGVDQLPLDPNNHLLPAVPGDSTPPTITLLKPFGATIIP